MEEIPTRTHVLFSLTLVAFVLSLPAERSCAQEATDAVGSTLAAKTLLDEAPSLATPEIARTVPDNASELDSSGSADLARTTSVSDGGVGGGQIKVVDQRPAPTEHVEQEILIEGLYSYGNYKIFASGYDDKLDTAGIEYNRHSWGNFLKGQMDYVAEFLPFVLLNKPLHTDQWGNPIDKNIRQYVYGIGFSPIGFRLQWRSNTRIRPFLEAKGGMLGFTKKAPAAQAAYENFSLQSMGGVQLKLNEKWGVRLGLFGDFHFSNAFVVPANPGLDVMNANLAVAYHF